MLIKLISFVHIKTKIIKTELTSLFFEQEITHQ